MVRMKKMSLVMAASALWALPTWAQSNFQTNGSTPGIGPSQPAGLAPVPGGDSPIFTHGDPRREERPVPWAPESPPDRGPMSVPEQNPEFLRPFMGPPAQREPGAPYIPGAPAGPGTSINGNNPGVSPNLTPGTVTDPATNR